MSIDALNGNTINLTTQQSEGPKPVQKVAPVQKADVKGEGKPIDKATSDQIQKAIKAANKRAQFGHASAQFSYHEPTKRISVKIIDQDTNEVIREIPPEETLEMISKMWELAGIMVDEKR